MKRFFSAELHKEECLNNNQLEQFRNKSLLKYGADENNCYIFIVFSLEQIELIPQIIGQEQTNFIESLPQLCELSSRLLNDTCMAAQLKSQAQIQSLRQQHILTVINKVSFF
jgi:hypothetical protein